MEDACMNHYEKQLYTVFKTFDVDNEEALDREAVLQLCDALQLEARGAALVESLFERRAERVTFATFRNGLLGVLGAAPDPGPQPPPAPGAPSAPLSDDDSSGREVAPKFVFGSKKYGRRSRPVRGADEPGPRAASASRLDADDARPRTRYRRSASAMEARDGLDHDRRIDRAQAVELCRDLHMDTIDPRLVERIFDDSPTEETTVGEFFDRLNAALTSIAAAGESPAPADTPPEPPPDADDDDDDAEAALPGEAVAEAWERAGVRRPRRLLAELGFGGAALSPPELERALDAELRALPAARDERLDARALLQQAALALGRLRTRRARARAAAAGAERDKLRADLAEANRRARLLAQDVDENHARLEAERQAALRQLEARHAEAARAADADRAAERERAAAQLAGLEAEAARRGEAEARLRAELATLRLRAEERERRASAAEERACAAERERARAEEEARGAAERAGREARGLRAAAEALQRQAAELRADNARLRDRADELAAGLEARARAAPEAPAACSWHDEAGLHAAPAPARIEESDSSPPSPGGGGLRDLAASPAPALRDLAASPAPCSVDAAAQTDPEPAGEGASRDHIEELQHKHQIEKDDLNNLVAELEGSVEALREEYERCEEYWARKLAEERALAGAEAAAGDARLAELLRRVAEYEAAFRPRLPALLEAQLEPQYNQLEQEFDEFKESAARELAAAREEAARAHDELTAARGELAAARGELAAARGELAAARGQAEQQAAAGQQEPAPAPAPRPASDGDQQRAAVARLAGAEQGEERRSAPGACAGAAAPAHAPAHAHAHAPGAAPPGHEGPWCGCAAWARRARAEALGLRARAGHAERAAARLLARLQAADALVADLYRENCQLQHHARPDARLL